MDVLYRRLNFNTKKGLHRDIQAFLGVFCYSQNTIYYLRVKDSMNYWLCKFASEISFTGNQTA
jgi:hypothetical protein